MLRKATGRRLETRDAVPAAEAMKADGASITALRTPNPPAHTGSDAYLQQVSFRVTFRMDCRLSRSVLSYRISSALLKHGVVRRMY